MALALTSGVTNVFISQAPLAATDPARELVAARGRMKILLIDDDVDSAEVVRELLENTWPVEVTIAIRAGDAQQLLEQSGFDHVAPFDLIVLDVGLPDFDGIELCRRIRLRPNLSLVPVVMVSGHTDERAIEAALDAGATDYVCKPVRTRELLARIRAALRDKLSRERQRDATHELETATADLRRTNASLERLTAVDPLTQLPNRRQFNQVFVREWRRAARTSSTLAVLMVDIDHFHDFNERYGHLAGDQCLVKVAGALKAAGQRPSDLPARWGGEEFLYVLPDTAIEGASTIAERVRAGVEQLRIPHEGSSTSLIVTVSVGAAAMSPTLDRSAEELLGAADAAMYRAKKLGRNRVSEVAVPARTVWLASDCALP